MAWLLEDHINEGKKELNFSEFGKYSARRKKSKFNSILSQVEKNEMPLESYTLIHRSAILNKEKKNQLSDWINSLGYD